VFHRNILLKYWLIPPSVQTQKINIYIITVKTSNLIQCSLFFVSIKYYVSEICKFFLRHCVFEVKEVQVSIVFIQILHVYFLQNFCFENQGII